MLGFQLGALIEFAQRFFILLLVHEDASAIVTGHHAFVGIEPHHPIKTAQGAFIFTIEPRQITTYKVDTDIVRIFLAQQLNFLTRFRFLPPVLGR